MWLVLYEVGIIFPSTQLSFYCAIISPVYFTSVLLLNSVLKSDICFIKMLLLIITFFMLPIIHIFNKFACFASAFELGIRNTVMMCITGSFDCIAKLTEHYKSTMIKIFFKKRNTVVNET